LIESEFVEVGLNEAEKRIMNNHGEASTLEYIPTTDMPVVRPSARR